MDEARLDLSRAVEDRLIEGLIVFLTKRAKGAGVSTLPAGVGSQVASSGAHLVDAATYELRKPCKGMRSQRRTV